MGLIRKPPKWWRDRHDNHGAWTFIPESHIGPVVFCSCSGEG